MVWWMDRVWGGGVQMIKVRNRKRIRKRRRREQKKNPEQADVRVNQVRRRQSPEKEREGSRSVPARRAEPNIPLPDSCRSACGFFHKLQSSRVIIWDNYWGQSSRLTRVSAATQTWNFMGLRQMFPKRWWGGGGGGVMKRKNTKRISSKWTFSTLHKYSRSN